VTQTLFSASLIAEVLPRLWARNQEEGYRRLDELRQLTRGALAEMRTLLLELRPEALADMELGDLLKQLAEAFTGRAGLAVKLEIDGQRHLPPDVRFALYRIAQEALNNVAKHANATEVELQVEYDADAVELHVCDDGKGFDPTQVRAGRFGLSSIQERSEAIGAELHFNTQPGRGTEVVVRWPYPEAWLLATTGVQEVTS